MIRFSNASEPIKSPTRETLLAELEGFEHLLFEPMAQADLDALERMQQQWTLQLGDSPNAIALCDALGDFIGAGIEDGDIEQAYLELVALIQRGGKPLPIPLLRGSLFVRIARPDATPQLAVTAWGKV